MPSTGNSGDPHIGRRPLQPHSPDPRRDPKIQKGEEPKGQKFLKKNFRQENSSKHTETQRAFPAGADPSKARIAPARSIAIPASPPRPFPGLSLPSSRPSSLERRRDGFREGLGFAPGMGQHSRFQGQEGNPEGKSPGFLPARGVCGWEGRKRGCSHGNFIAGLEDYPRSLCFLIGC